MTYTISKQFDFSASHQLFGLPDGHPCGRLHGHNYRVIIVLSSPTVDTVGFVRDYGDLKQLKNYIDANLDHRHLNDVIPGNPTAENIARYLYAICREWWPETSEIRVSETPKTWAQYG